MTNKISVILHCLGLPEGYVKSSKLTLEIQWQKQSLPSKSSQSNEGDTMTKTIYKPDMYRNIGDNLRRKALALRVIRKGFLKRVGF